VRNFLLPHLRTGKEGGNAGAPEVKPIETEWRIAPKALDAKKRGLDRDSTFLGGS